MPPTKHPGVTAAARAVLTDDRHRRGARALADEIAALPGPEGTATIIEELARQPVP